jgi:hypothetical protein
MNFRTPIVGVDFDNTIACYDDLLFRLAVERGLIPPDSRLGKKAIRDQIRALPGGDIEWQRLQAVMYGPAIDGAVPFAGVFDFLSQCRSANIRVFIISHKTPHSNLLGGGVNFREAATRWLRARGFFGPGGPGLLPAHVFYESTRQEKINRIRALGCTDFVDDLEETFLEEAFPAGVTKVLFNPHGEPVEADDVHECSEWDQIQDLIVHDCCHRL